MNAAMSHNRFRELVATYREGWLDSAERERFERHLHECRECAVEMRRDEHLSRLLASVAEEPVPYATWEIVQASRRPHPARRTAWRPALAFATVAAIVVVGYNAVRQDFFTPDTPPPMPAVVADSDSRLLVDAHQMMSASSATGDPSAAMLLVVTTRQRTGSTP